MTTGGALHPAILAAALMTLDLSHVARAEESVVPGLDQIRNVAHGSVATEWYDSRSLGFKRKVQIYTPPGYRKDLKYAVLYLLHGASDDESSWVQKGRAHTILDNLYADGKAGPMIVVMPNGFTSRAGTLIAMDAKAFEQDVLGDLIPFIQSHYPVLADADHRALAGVSMGGTQSLRIGLAHCDTFAYLGVFSAGLAGAGPVGQLDLTSAYPEAQTLNACLKLFWVSCGDRDRLLPGAERLHQRLNEKKINHTWHQSSGGHEWPVWRHDFYLFAQRLFPR